MLLLHSVADPRAIELFRRDLDHNQLRLLAEPIGGDEAGVRAVMVLAQLMGFAIMHQVLRPEAFAEAQARAGGPPLQEPRRLYRLCPLPEESKGGRSSGRWECRLGALPNRPPKHKERSGTE